MGNLCFKDYDDENRLNNYPGYTGSPLKNNSPVSKNSSPKWKSSKLGSEYIFYNDMDDNNKKAMDIQVTKGWDAAINHMMTNPDGKPRTYAEMRELYG